MTSLQFTSAVAAVLMSQLAVGAPSPGNSAQLLKDLQKLSVVGGALYVAAHPDDENTRLLASLANGVKVRTAYLSLTRGEGGQNLIGPEIGPLLGVIRTQELLAARRVDGAEQFFTTARDFGYSKSVDETMEIWGKDFIVDDAVRVIRTLRPDVIITRFSLEGGDTHGHHTASARIALEAFAKAGDPKYEVKGTTAWQAKRIVWNAWSRDGSDKEFATRPMVFDSSAYDPLLGMTYGELAALSRSMHKSQGFGAAPVHGPSPEQFVLIGGAAGASLFDGVDLTWGRVAGAEKLSALLKKAEAEFRPAQPQASVPTLLLALDALRALKENPYQQAKLVALSELIIACSGVYAEATAATFSALASGPVDVSTYVINRTPAQVTLKSVSVVAAAEYENLDAEVGAVGSPTPLREGVPAQQKLTVTLPPNVVRANPPWLDQAPGKGTWFLSGPLVNAPEVRPPLTARMTFTFDGRDVTVTRPVTYKWTDPTAGERFRPLEVLSRVALAAEPPLVIFDAGASKPVRVTVTAMADGQEGTVHLAVPPTLGEGQPFSLKKKGDSATFTFMVKPEDQRRVAIARFSDGSGGGRSVTRLDYPHIPIQTLTAPPEVRLMKLNMAKGRSRIGYFAGAGDEVAESLRRIGYDVTNLTEETVAQKSLSSFDAIVIGIRAYNVNPRLPALFAPLMKYVSDGGTLLVQYNTKNWLSNVPAQLGPSPFEITQNRVTDENATVTFELPKHRVLNAPNKLTQEDFTEWVQERGLYFAGGFDERQYESPLSMHDAGEAPQRGSLIIKKYGKGTFIYTGLSFFRQLPAGVPGAYRLFANLLAANGS